MCLLSNAQNNFTKKYDSFFKEPRTRPFVHIDKTAYLQKENLYYQAYLINNQTQFLNTKVKNVVVEVYNASGEMLLQQLKLARSGIVQGDFKIDSTYKSKNYFLKIRIKKDEAFPYEQNYLTKFELINKRDKKSKIKKGYIKVVPESGNLIYGLPNTLSIRYVKPDKVNKEYEATLLKNGKSIAEIKSNKYGLARYRFTPLKDNDYTLKFKYITEDIPDHELAVSDHGAVFNINQLNNSYILNLVAKLKNIPAKDELKLMIHQEGKRFFVPLDVSTKSFKRQLKISKDKLFRGVNTISLFRKNKLLAERIFMNKPEILDQDDEITIQQVPTTHKDSLNFKLQFPKGQSKFFVSSISVFPQQSLSHYPNDNLASTVYLSPYLKEPVNHAAYYFNQDDKRTDYFLDLLMINQNGSRYNWDDIFNQDYNFKTEYEDGMPFKFNLQSRIRRNDEYLLFYPGLYQDESLLEIDETLTLNNQHRLEDGMMRFSIINKRKKFRAPQYSMSNLYEFPQPESPDYDVIAPLTKISDQIENNQKKFVNSFKEAEELDEVLIVSEKEEEESLDFDNSFGTKYDITRDIAESYMFLSDYLASKGLQVREENGNLSIIIPRKRNVGSVLIFLDDVPLSDPSIIYRTFLSEYRAISINKTGFGLGMRGQGGAIRLYTRNEPFKNFSNNNKWSKRRHTNSSVYKVDKGFTAPHPFQVGEYLLFNRSVFEKVGTLAWIPAYDSEDNKKYFRVYNANFKKIYFYIQGITADGKIINKKVLKEITTD